MFEERIGEPAAWFMGRGYEELLVSKQISKASKVDRRIQHKT